MKRARKRIDPPSNKALFDYQNGYTQKERILERRSLDPAYRLRMNFAALLRYHLKTKNRKHTFDVLGYSVRDLMAHLEKQFAPKMNWQNYGRQPLTVKDNTAKGARLVS